MNARPSTLVFLGMALFCNSVLNAPAQAQTLQYDDFSDLSRFTLNGSTKTLNVRTIWSREARVLRLTNERWQNSSAFLTQPVSLGHDASFSTVFSFQITNPQGISDADGKGADGLVFVVQPVACDAGGSGGGLGYGGIKKSLGVEFDTWENQETDHGDPDGNHVGINLNGSLISVKTAPVRERLNDGHPWFAWIDYDGGKDRLELRLADSAARPEMPTLVYGFDLADLMGKQDVYVGFCSGTGAASGVHDILNWKFATGYKPFDVKRRTPNVRNVNFWKVNCLGREGTLEYTVVDHKLSGTLFGKPAEGYLVGPHIALFWQGDGDQMWTGLIGDPSDGGASSNVVSGIAYVEGKASYPWFGMSRKPLFPKRKSGGKIKSKK